MKTEVPKHGAGVISFMSLTGFLFFLPSAALAQAQCGCMPRDGGTAIYFSCNSPPPARCTGRSTAGSSGSSSTGNAAAVIGNAIGQAIIQGLLSSPPQDAGQRAAEDERRRQQLLDQHRRQRELEEQRREKLEEDKRELLGQMMGGSDGGLRLRGEDTIAELSFKEYHERETERREVLGRLSKKAFSDSEAKATLDWCKLHPPLYPTRSASDEQYQEKLASYETRIAEWRQKCASSDELAGSSVATLPAASGPGSQRQAVTQESPQVLPQSCADCLAQQEMKVRDCRQPTLMDQLDCVNAANREWDQCQETCRP